MKPIFISSIKQKDNYTFSVVWSDEVSQDFRLSHLQRNCPCAACVDEATGKRLVEANAIHDNVMAISIKSVGRYAIKIQYTNGCSAGIYSFDFLRQLVN